MTVLLVVAGFVLVVLVISVVLSRRANASGTRSSSTASDHGGDANYIATYPGKSSGKHHSDSDHGDSDSGGDGGGGDGGGGGGGGD